MEPQTARKLASELRRFDEWMTIFGGWRGPVPSTIKKGTRVSSCIKVMGFRDIVHWEVTRYDESKSIDLQGRSRGGIRIAVAMTPSGPIGGVVARVLRSEVRKLVNNPAAPG